jgi:hypothetical protein
LEHTYEKIENHLLIEGGFLMGILTKIICKLKGHIYEETNRRPDGWGYVATWFLCNRCGHEKVVTIREDEV